MDSATLPDFVEEGIKKICKRAEIPDEEVRRDYLALYNDDFVQKDEQFSTDEERHTYSLAVLHMRFISRPPAKEVTIVVIGYSGRRLARSSGNPSCTLFVLIKGQNKIKRVVCRGPLADVYRSISLFNGYTVKLGEFKKGGDLIADARAVFSNPIRLKIEPRQLMEKIGVKRIKIKDTSKFPSALRAGQRKGSTYVDRADWRCVRGIIVREFRGTRDDETEYGCYTISDETVNGEPTVADDGTVIMPGFTAWTDPSHMIFGLEDQIDLYGTIRINKDQDAQMDALLILPVHARGGASQ